MLVGSQCSPATIVAALSDKWTVSYNLYTQLNLKTKIDLQYRQSIGIDVGKALPFNQ